MFLQLSQAKIYDNPKNKPGKLSAYESKQF